MRHTCSRSHCRPVRIGGYAWRLAAALLAGAAAFAPAASASWSTPPATGPGPRGTAIDDAGNVYTANFGSTGQPAAQAVTKITSSGVSLGGCGATNASGIGSPHSIAVGPTGDLFVKAKGAYPITVGAWVAFRSDRRMAPGTRKALRAMLGPVAQGRLQGLGYAPLHNGIRAKGRAAINAAR